MNGLPAVIVDWSAGEGHVLAQGERWRAKAVEAFAPGEHVEVTGIKDLVLFVRRRQIAKPSDGERR